MIKDSLKNVNRYTVNEDFEVIKKIFNQKKGDPIELTSTIKAVDLNYETRDFDYATFENHTRNIDIHVVLQGEEKIALSAVDELNPSTGYNEEKDYQIFEGLPREEVVVREGEFLMLFPGEAHITGGRINETKKISKKVFKLLVT